MGDVAAAVAEGLSAIQSLGASACECLVTEREILTIDWGAQ